MTRTFTACRNVFSLWVLLAAVGGVRYASQDYQVSMLGLRVIPECPPCEQPAPTKGLDEASVIDIAVNRPRRQDDTGVEDIRP